MGEYKVTIPVLIANQELSATIYIPNTAYEHDGDACEIHIWLSASDLRYFTDDAICCALEQQFSKISQTMRSAVHKIADLYNIILSDDAECFGIHKGMFYFMFSGTSGYRVRQ